MEEGGSYHVLGDIIGSVIVVHLMVSRRFPSTVSISLFSGAKSVETHFRTVE